MFVTRDRAIRRVALMKVTLWEVYGFSSKFQNTQKRVANGNALAYYTEASVKKISYIFKHLWQVL